MQESIASQTKEWVNQLREELERQTGRNDVEVTTSPYCSYDVLVSATAEGRHPIVNFYSAIQGDSPRIKSALDYAVGMLQNWEVTKVLHDKAKQDCLPFYERLKSEFPHLELTYSVLDFERHFLSVQKADSNKIVASFDLWPGMSDSDVERLISYIRGYEATLHREGSTLAEMTYWWK